MVNLATGGYATVSDFADWIDPETVPDRPESLLRYASVIVAQACSRDPYTDNPAGTDADVLRDATCAQAESWMALGIDPAKVGIDGPPPVKRSKVLSGDVEYDTKAQAEARSLAARELAPNAASILQAAGLLWEATARGEDSNALPTWGQPIIPVGVVGPNHLSMDWPFL